MAIQLSGPGLAVRSDFETLAELWALSFDDALPFIRTFQSLLAKEDCTVVYRENGTVVSGAYLIETTLHVGGATYPAYLFAGAATHPDYRRKGYMEQVIRYCRGLCERREVDYLVLVPVNNDLYQYFSRFGFRANFYLKTTQLDKGQFVSLVERITNEKECIQKEPERFVPTQAPTVREAALSDGTHLEYDAPTLQYLFFEHLYRGGKTILLEDGYVLYDLLTDDTGETTLHVKELCCTGSVGALLQKVGEVGADKYVLDLPAFDTIRGGKTATGRAGMDLAVSKKAVKAERAMKNAYIGPVPG